GSVSPRCSPKIAQRRAEGSNGDSERRRSGGPAARYGEGSTATHPGRSPPISEGRRRGPLGGIVHGCCFSRPSARRSSCPSMAGREPGNWEAQSSVRTSAVHAPKGGHARRRTQETDGNSLG